MTETKYTYMDEALAGTGVSEVRSARIMEYAAAYTPLVFGDMKLRLKSQTCYCRKVAGHCDKRSARRRSRRGSFRVHHRCNLPG